MSTTYPSKWQAPAGIEQAPVATADVAPSFAFAQAQRLRLLKLRHHQKQIDPAGMKTAAELWPKAQAKIKDLALSGKLTDSQRKEAEWLGFELPSIEERYPKKQIKQFEPPVKPVASAEDTALLIAGAQGPATADQIFEFPTDSALRRLYDDAPQEKHIVGYIIAARRVWRIEQHSWGKDGIELSARTEANANRRIKAEKVRVNKTNAARKLPPLTAEFYGQAPEIAARYTTPEEANAHEMRRRRDWLHGMRDSHAKRIWEIRQIIQRQNDAVIANWYTEWQRRRWGKSLGYMLSFFHDKEQELLTGKKKALTIPVSQMRHEK